LISTVIVGWSSLDITVPCLDVSGKAAVAATQPDALFRH
jgi:hypothetical protein